MYTRERERERESESSQKTDSWFFAPGRPHHGHIRATVPRRTLLLTEEEEEEEVEED